MAWKLFENGVDELFVEKPSWTSNTVTIGVEIPNFQKKMEEQKIVDSPRFKLSGLEFNIQVKAGTEKDPEFIGVFLQNDSKEAQTTSVTLIKNYFEQYFSSTFKTQDGSDGLVCFDFWQLRLMLLCTSAV